MNVRVAIHSYATSDFNPTPLAEQSDAAASRTMLVASCLAYFARS